MKSKIILIFVIFIYNFSLKAQIADVIWQTCLGATDGQNWTEAAVKTDNGYMFGIYILNDGPGVSNYHGGADAWIVNTNELGDVIWERCYGGSSGDGPHKIIRIDANAYYLFNHASSTDGDVHNFQGKDFWMVKIKANGEILWEKNYGGSVNGEIAVDAILMPDKGALMMGRLSSSGGDVTHSYGDMDVWLCRIDSVGDIIWQKTIGNFGKDNGLKVKLTLHNSILFIGGHEVTGGMIDCPDLGYYIDTDVWILEMDMDGNFINQWCFGGKYYDLGYDILEESAGYTFVASTRSNDRDVSGFHGPAGENESSDIWVVNINFQGNIIWQKCLGGYSYEWPIIVTKTSDSGYIIIGNTNSHDGDVTGNHTTESNETDIWVVKLSSDGQLLWEHCFGGLGTDRFWGIHSVVKNDDYNYIIGANSNHASGDVTCNLFPYEETSNAWLFEIKDCFYYMPLPPDTIIGPDTVCSTVNPESLYYVETVPWATGYDWVIDPDSAGIFFLDSASIHANWNPLFGGSVTVKARSYNDCGFSAWSEPHVTQVFSCLGVNEHGGTEAWGHGGMVLWPNPARDIVDFRWSIFDGRFDLTLRIYDLFGREIRKIAIPENEHEIQFSVENFISGLYVIVIKDGNSIIGSAKMVIAR